MATRILYLHYRSRTKAGPSAIWGSRMAQVLDDKFDQIIFSHILVDDATLSNAHPLFGDDAVSLREIDRAGVNVIYSEGASILSLSEIVRTFGK